MEQNWYQGTEKKTYKPIKLINSSLLQQCLNILQNSLNVYIIYISMTYTVYNREHSVDSNSN